MNRRSMTGVSFALTLAACAVDLPDEPTSPTEQAVTSPYCGAQMPATPYWNGSVPKPTSANQIFLLFRDPANASEWVGVLADPVQGKLVWGARVKGANNLGPFVDGMDNGGQLDYVRRPLPPPPGPIGQGAFLLEWADRSLAIPGEIQSLDACKL